MAEEERVGVGTAGKARSECRDYRLYMHCLDVFIKSRNYIIHCTRNNDKWGLEVGTWVADLLARTDHCAVGENIRQYALLLHGVENMQRLLWLPTYSASARQGVVCNLSCQESCGFCDYQKSYNLWHDLTKKTHMNSSGLQSASPKAIWSHNDCDNYLQKTIWTRKWIWSSNL